MDLKPYNEREFNRLCAEFLEIKFNEKRFDSPNEKAASLFIKINTLLHCYDIDCYNIENIIPEEYYKFHSDWNWIIEVKKAIESIRLDIPNYYVIEWFEVHLYSSGCLIKSGLRHADGETTSPYYYENSIWRKDSKEAVVQAIWEFLQWYNKQKS